MFELPLYLPLSLFLSLKFIQGIFSLRAFLTWPLHVGVYQSLSMTALTLAFRKSSLSLSLEKKGKKDKKASPADHLIISCSPLWYVKCTCQ